eukprot:SAG22_NODE_171_length_16646_cov_6.580528_4_plen_180_part_00
MRTRRAGCLCSRRERSLENLTTGNELMVMIHRRPDKTPQKLQEDRQQAAAEARSRANEAPATTSCACSARSLTSYPTGAPLGSWISAKATGRRCWPSKPSARQLGRGGRGQRPVALRGGGDFGGQAAAVLRQSGGGWRGAVLPDHGGGAALQPLAPEKFVAIAAAWATECGRIGAVRTK